MPNVVFTYQEVAVTLMNSIIVVFFFAKQHHENAAKLILQRKSTSTNQCRNDRHCGTMLLQSLTSSSAVAKKPLDASYLSVVSFNSTKRRLESFIVSHVGYRFVTACSSMCCSVVFGVTSRLLVINISSSSPTINTAAYYQRCVNLRVGSRRPPATLLTTPDMLQR